MTNPTDTNQASEDELDASKICTGCGQVKSTDEFHRKSDRKSGITAQCKPCMNKKHRQKYPARRATKLVSLSSYYKNNKEKFAETALKNPDETAARKAVRNAVAQGKFGKEPCEFCGDIKAEFHHTNGYSKENQLVGVWLCRKDHAIVHRLLRGSIRTEKLKLLAEVRERVVKRYEDVSDADFIIESQYEQLTKLEAEL